MQNNELQILLADDEENDRLLFTDALNELKVKTIVHTVNDGVELMDYLSKAGNTLTQLPINMTLDGGDHTAPSGFIIGFGFCRNSGKRKKIKKKM